MPHNPPRPRTLDDAAIKRMKQEAAREPRRLWHDLGELAALLKKRAAAGKTVTMKASTAAFVAAHIETAAAKPTRDEVARLICARKCESLCYDCLGRANMVVAAYGHSIEGTG